MYFCGRCGGRNFDWTARKREVRKDYFSKTQVITWEFSIHCSECDEIQNVTEKTFSYDMNASDVEIQADMVNFGSKFLSDFLLSQANEEVVELQNKLLEASRFNPCKICETSDFVSLEKATILYKPSSPFTHEDYKVRCHGCATETLAMPTAQAAIDLWNECMPIEEEG